MKLVSAWILILFHVSCAGQATDDERWQEVKSEPERRIIANASSQISDQVPATKKALTGKVTFAGWSAEELADFRVLPESGRETFIPKNQHYPAIDGLWWRGDAQRWFKIPDHTTAWVLAGEQKPPVTADGISPNGELMIYWKTIPGLSFLSGRLPGWFPNTGDVKIGVAYPF